MFNDKRERPRLTDVTQDSTGRPRSPESQSSLNNHSHSFKLSTLSRLGIGVSITAMTALTFAGIAAPQMAHADGFDKTVNKKVNGVRYKDFTTYYSELKKDGYVAKRDWGNIPTSSHITAQFFPVFKAGKTKVTFSKGAKTGRPASISSRAAVTSVKNTPGSTIYYKNVGKFNGKVVDMSLSITKKAAGLGGRNEVYFMTKRLGLAIPKNATANWTYADTKGIYSTDTGSAKVPKSRLHRVSGVSRQQTGGNFKIHLYYDKSKKTIPLDNDNQVGIDFMEMESPWFHIKGQKARAYSYAQRVLAYTKPTMVGNFGGNGSSSADRALAKKGILGIEKRTTFPSGIIGSGIDFQGGNVKQSVMGRWSTGSIDFSWRGHAALSDILEINGGTYPVTPPKSPKQPAPKKYVGPQSSKPSTYKATKSALADYTKTFSWKIVQKTKKAKFSGKGYTITDTLPSGTSISSVTSPSGWSKSVSGNKVTFKATKNVYKTTHTYNFYVASSTTKSQALRHTSFNNHVTSRRKITKSKWQTKNSNTAKWTLKNEEIKGYFIDFDHHDHAVAKGYDIFTPKQIYDSGVTSGQKTITPLAEAVAPDNGKLYKLVHGPNDGTYATPSEMKWTSARIKIVNHYKTATRTVGYTKKGKPITESYQYLAYQTFPNGDDKQIHYWYYRTKWYHQVGHAKQGTDPNPYTDSTDPDGDLIKADGNKGEFYQINNSSGSTRKLCLT
ncbi:hypothetical protein ACFQ44_01195 [Levilactobacillus lanxiensis]|uniref:Uncharacterized protein n=1 Tax=Levilactobacillus lanxiensis TaxID=2799568 RepID=A0ABW4D2W6_9LACO|nr:hypothetical protein [Levilactobacillus lanxiensis]